MSDDGRDDHLQERDRQRPPLSGEARRYALPKDLSRALAWLDANEITALFIAVADELARRGSLSAATRAKLVVLSKDAGTGSSERDAKRKAAGGLTVGQSNAVRAAFAAGIKPATIARQFGIAPTAVKAVLTAMSRPRS